MTIPKACIMGWPVSQSRSPLIHGWWLKTYGLQGQYDRQPVEPDKAHDYFRALKHHGYCGGNVTAPLKQIAFAAVDGRDDAADNIGAVNTLWYEGDRLIGGNTDAYGYAANLSAQCPDWQSVTETALVLGAGGAALSVVYALKKAGVPRILVANRSLANAETLAARFGNSVTAMTNAHIARHLPQTDLLINTTTLGMVNQPELHLPLDGLKAGAIVSDIVYVPLKTRLVRDAEGRGFAISTGLGMLLHQAVPGFERWFGLRPDVTAELTSLVTADIAEMT